MDRHEFEEMCDKAEKIFEKHLKVVLEELEKNPKPNKDAIEMILDALEFIEMHMRRRQRGGNNRRDYDDDDDDDRRGGRRDRGRDRDYDRDYSRQQGGWGNGSRGWNGNGQGGWNGNGMGQQGGNWM